MRRTISLLVSLAITAASIPAWGQESKGPAIFTPDAAAMKAIDEKRAKLKIAIARLHDSERAAPAKGEALFRNFYWLPMVEVFAKAAEWTIRHNEFYQKDSGKQILAILDEGLRRASLYPNPIGGPLELGGKSIPGGYRSAVDGSIQAYVATFPSKFGEDLRKKWRLDVVLHGRDNTLTEVKFLAAALRRGPAKREQDFIQLDVFGRGNNAYRWAGETDVFEARDAVIQLVKKFRWPNTDSIDLDRVVLRGFSMGGAGAWHIGLHWPTDWCVIGPCAGFTSTHGYIKNLPAKLPDYQEACLHIYDTVDYAENVAMVPVVAYAGDKDPQQEAARNIEEKLKPLGIPMTRLVGAGLAHQFPPEWQKKAQEAYAPFVEKGRNLHSKRIHFVTYSLGYGSCDWITLLELEHQYQKAVVDGNLTTDGFDLETKNVQSFWVRIQPEHKTLERLVVRINGETLSVKRRPLEESRPAYDTNIRFTKEKWGWREGIGEGAQFQIAKLDDRNPSGDGSRSLRPRKDLFAHGPIDDAFRFGFVCIKGTGKCASAAVQAYTDAALERFRREWDLYFRGDLPVMTDTEFLKEATKENHEIDSHSLVRRSLVLFGDPTSNAVLAKVMKEGRIKMPLEWTEKEIAFGGRTYTADCHVPAFIYPNPIWPSRYIVVNSGHTFHEADLKGTNALLYPRLGDFAILKPAPTSKDPAAALVVRAGLFDEAWCAPSER